ncbi:MAG: formylmethanofuran dehydrogenase [Deltaproteobacteria bacterium]|nr:formylmethanofuran dehydrogenase [Deltaproteobacteria bacterium]
MNSFNELLARSVKEHGHLCPGQVLGVRMAMLGLELLDYEAPLDKINIKKVVVFVEIDRCAADAIATTTGVKLGRRSLKFKDYGLMAATFVNLPDGLAFRVAVREDCRSKAGQYVAGISDRHERETKAYQLMPLSELFTVMAVEVEIPPEDLPGLSRHKVSCEQCGAEIRHKREVKANGRFLCRVCAGEAYFKPLRPVRNLDALSPNTARVEGPSPFRCDAEHPRRG